MQATQAKLKQQVAEVMTTVDKVYPGVKLGMPTVGFYYKGLTAGKAYWMQNKVEFNAVLAKENDGKFFNTVIHEVAHLVQFKLHPYSKQHGPEFKRIFVSLGGNGECCHNYDTSSVSTGAHARVFEYKCACQSHKVSARKHSNMQRPGAKYVCKRCKQPVVYAGKITATKSTPVLMPKVTVPQKHVPVAKVAKKAISTKGDYRNGTMMYCEKRGKYVVFHDGKIEVRGATEAKAKTIYIKKFGFPVKFELV